MRHQQTLSAFTGSLVGGSLGYTLGFLAGWATTYLLGPMPEARLEGTVLIWILAFGFIGLITGFWWSQRHQKRSFLATLLFGAFSSTLSLLLSRTFMETLGPSFGSLFFIFVLIPSCLAVPVTYLFQNTKGVTRSA